MRPGLVRSLSIAAVALVAIAPTAPAGAVTPPAASIGAAPPDNTEPETNWRRNARCNSTGVLPNSDLAAKPAPASELNLSRAHEFSTGAGVTVAVLDTGVRSQPRLPGVIAGGDLIEPGERGLVDCDGHGTLVAGIVAGKPSASDGFVGVAPDARIMSIRVASGIYTPQNMTGDQDDPNASRAAIRARGLARAIVRAANTVGPRGVIVIPSAICVDVTKNFDQRGLGGALALAAAKDVLVVAGAGDVERQGTSPNDTSCKANPTPQPTAALNDPRNWGGVTTISTPSWFDAQVLSVGYVSATGQPREELTLGGPWVDVVAPGSGLVSLSPNAGDGPVNGVIGDGKIQAFAGTEMSTAFVAGQAALIRSRFPRLSAQQVAARIIATAHRQGGLDNAVGGGMIDPVASLTYSGLDVNGPITVESVAELTVPPPPAGPDLRPRITAAIAFGAVALAAVLAAVIVPILRRRPVKGEQSR